MSAEPVYVTMLGRSVWALLNSYYAVVRDGGFKPKKIVVFGEDVFSGQKPVVEDGLRIISEEFGLTPTIRFEMLKEADFIEAGKRISQLIKETKDQRNPVAIDITPGRKAMVAGALVPLAKIDVDHVFYLLIKSLHDAAKPYMMIPFQNQQLKDFKDQKTGVKS